MTRLRQAGMMGHKPHPRTPDDPLDTPVIPIRRKGRPRTRDNSHDAVSRREYAVARYWTDANAKVWARFRLTKLKSKAARLGVAFDLTQHDLLDLLDESEMQCPVFNLELVFGRGTGETQPNGISLLRLDDSKPFTRSNMIATSTAAARVLCELGPEQVVQLGRFAQAMLVAQRVRTICKKDMP